MKAWNCLDRGWKKRMGLLNKKIFLHALNICVTLRAIIIPTAYQILNVSSLFFCLLHLPERAWRNLANNKTGIPRECSSNSQRDENECIKTWELHLCPKCFFVSILGSRPFMLCSAAVTVYHLQHRVIVNGQWLREFRRANTSSQGSHENTFMQLSFEGT